MKNPKRQLVLQMWSGLTVINLRQISIVSPLIIIRFLNLTWHIPYTSKNQLFIVKSYGLKDYVCRHWHLKNTLRVYVTVLGNVIILRNLQTINLEGQQKADWSRYLNIKPNMDLVRHLWIHTILGFMIQVGSLQKISFTYMPKNKSNRSLHQPHLCRFNQDLVKGTNLYPYHIVGICLKF